MLFNSFDFLFFFLLVFVLQAVLPHRPRNLLLLAGSYFFYGCWDWRFLSLILISTFVDYACGLGLAASTRPARRKAWVTASMVTNLSLLGVFKYAGFFVYSARHALAPLGVNPDLLHLDLVLPVGISFYTFQTMSYSIDVYRGRMQPVRNFIDFALFVAFFPQLVAGPIERARQLAPQFSHKPVVTYDMLRVAAG